MTAADCVLGCCAAMGCKFIELFAMSKASDWRYSFVDHALRPYSGLVLTSMEVRVGGLGSFSAVGLS